MKTQLLILIGFSISLVISNVHADESYRPQCLDAQPQAANLVQKLDDHHYEIYIYGKQAVLVTKRAIYTRTGYVAGIKIRQGIGSQHVLMKNGFSTYLGFYEECGIVPYTKAHNVIRSPFFAQRKQLKEDFK